MPFHSRSRGNSGQSSEYGRMGGEVRSAHRQTPVPHTFGRKGRRYRGPVADNRVFVSATGTIWMVGLTNSRDLEMLGGYHSRYGGGEQDGFLIELSPSGKLCYGTYAGSTARALLEGVAFADSERVLYAVGTVIRPIEKSSPAAQHEGEVRDVCRGTGDTEALPVKP
jgi:hypothetical protein